MNLPYFCGINYMRDDTTEKRTEHRLKLQPSTHGKPQLQPSCSVDVLYPHPGWRLRYLCAVIETYRILAPTRTWTRVAGLYSPEYSNPADMMSTWHAAVETQTQICVLRVWSKRRCHCPTEPPHRLLISIHRILIINAVNKWYKQLLWTIVINKLLL